MKKLKLKRWVLVGLHIILVTIIIYLIICLFTRKVTVISEGKNYTCYGSIVLRVCSGEDYDTK